MSNLLYLTPLGIAFFLALSFTLLIKKLAVKLKIVDFPNPRKIHQKPTPLLGGVAIFLAFSLTMIIFWYFGYIEDIKISSVYILSILISGLILIIGGVLDDVYNLKPWQQIIWPIISILIIVVIGIKVEYVTNPLGGVLKFPYYLGLIFAFFWLLGMIYTTKVLDGLDGLVVGITAIGSIIIFIVSLDWDIPSSGTSFLALILAGSVLGFLVFNWHPAKIFLGESGSVFCGFMLGILAIISGSKIATALLIMGIPILDVLWVIIRRIWQKKSPTEADRKHLHFRLLDIGLNQKQAVIFLYTLTTAFGVASLFLHSKGKVIALFILALFMVFLALSLVLIYKSKTKNETRNN